MTEIKPLKIDGTEFYPEVDVDAVVGLEKRVTVNMIPWIGFWGQNDLTKDEASKAKSGQIFPFGEMIGVGSPKTIDATPLKTENGKLRVTRDCKIFGDVHFYAHLYSFVNAYVYMHLDINGTEKGLIAACGDQAMSWRNDLQGMFYVELKKDDVIHMHLETNQTSFVDAGIVSAIFQEVY